MDVGIQMIFSTYGWPGMSDREAWQEEIRLARLADELGFDVIWSVEHHFSDYSFCPDNTQLLSYLAPLCTHADLGTAAIILPWHDPLRVAEKVSVLDLLSNGRVVSASDAALRGASSPLSAAPWMSCANASTKPPR